MQELWWQYEITLFYLFQKSVHVTPGWVLLPWHFAKTNPMHFNQRHSTTSHWTTNTTSKATVWISALWKRPRKSFLRSEPSPLLWHRIRRRSNWWVPMALWFQSFSINQIMGRFFWLLRRRIQIRMKDRMNTKRGNRLTLQRFCSIIRNKNRIK